MLIRAKCMADHFYTQAFIAQDAGDATQCWAFVSAACKTCADLDIRPQDDHCEIDTAEERYHCYIWCQILDKNFSMMLGKKQCILEHEELDLVFASPLSSLLSPITSLYLQFVPIQAMFMSSLQGKGMTNDDMPNSKADNIIADVLRRLMNLEKGITEVFDITSSLINGSVAKK